MAVNTGGTRKPVGARRQRAQHHGHHEGGSRRQQDRPRQVERGDEKMMNMPMVATCAAVRQARRATAGAADARSSSAGCAVARARSLFVSRPLVRSAVCGGP